ncbi:MAG: 2-phospho-L-lactate transferase [Thermoproteota archaeon]|nr:2-phospho-L-lactate transferase [Thermoproteota archaeon]
MAGGTGSIKLVRGIYQETKDIAVISNVADNFWCYGLYICPDIDTVIYGLSNNLDKKKGWGIKEDTFRFLEYMKKIGEDTWFSLGDKDLSTHILRTKMLREGKKLSEVTDFFAKKYNIAISVIPASDNHYETHVITKNKKMMHLQEFWVKNRGILPVADVVYHQIEKAALSDKAKETLQKSRLIIFAPGNPISSIGPIINLEGFKTTVKPFRKKIITISPFVSDRAISGPSEKYMKAKGIKPNCQGIIDFYSEYCENFVFSDADKNKIKIKKSKDTYNINNTNLYFTNIIMNSLGEERSFAKYLLSRFYYD